MNDITVIAFYPGVGGNRYLQKLLNREFKTAHISYDSKSINQLTSHRYLLDEVIDSPRSNYVLTHCMNYAKIRSAFGDVDIKMIETDFKKSIRREWMLDGQSLYNRRYTENQEDIIVDAYNGIMDSSWPVCTCYDNFLNLPMQYQIEVLHKLKITPPELMSAWAVITWHNDYYNQYPVSIPSTNIVIDEEFMSIMQIELDHYQNDIFEFCWDNRDPSTPIVDLYHRELKGAAYE